MSCRTINVCLNTADYETSSYTVSLAHASW